MKKIGIVAGRGKMPQLLISACKKKGIPFAVLGLKNHTDMDLSAYPHQVIRLGAVGKGFDFFKKQECDTICLIGAVKRPTITELRPDIRGLKFFSKIGFKSLGDDGLLRSVIKEIEQEGFSVIGADELLDDVLVQKKIYTKLKANIKEVEFGIRIAHLLGDADVGQSVVIQDGLVLGVEAIEGTDALITRCAQIKRKGDKPILIKVKKPKQERRADLPTIGLQTIKLLSEKGYAGVVIESGGAFFVDEKESVDLANRKKMFIVGI